MSSFKKVSYERVVSKLLAKNRSPNFTNLRKKNAKTLIPQDSEVKLEPFKRFLHIQPPDKIHFSWGKSLALYPLQTGVSCIVELFKDPPSIEDGVELRQAEFVRKLF